jgi:predicted enzyme related to lactoylglutathione lyase
MPNPVTHFEIMGKGAIALQKFYHDVFGWKLAAPIAEMGNYSLLDNEGQGIGEDDHPRVTVYIEVDDPQAYLDKAIKAGGKLMMGVSQVTPDTMIAIFSDPAGNATGLLKAHSQ